jgi:hypothetical protein
MFHEGFHGVRVPFPTSLLLFGLHENPIGPWPLSVFVYFIDPEILSSLCEAAGLGYWELAQRTRPVGGHAIGTRPESFADFLQRDVQSVAGVESTQRACFDGPNDLAQQIGSGSG